MVGAADLLAAVVLLGLGLFAFWLCIKWTARGILALAGLVMQAIDYVTQFERDCR